MLTKRQQQVARAFFEGYRSEQIIQQYGISARRLRNWLNHELFQQELQRLCAESVRETRFLITRFGPHAALKLVELLASDKPDTARRAALDLIDRCLDRKTPPPDNLNENELPLSDQQTQEMLKTLAEGFNG